MTVPRDIPPFPPRADDAHKGDVGRIVVIGGRFDDVGMVGAPALVANAAFRAGAGLVQIVTPRDAQVAVSILAPCATTRTLKLGESSRLADYAAEFDADVVAIGPGLSPEISSADVVTLLQRFEGPTVVDADALNRLAEVGLWKAARPAQVVVTPHPGEMRRLLTGLSIKADTARRTECAQELARKTQTVVVHKGAGTVVTDGTRTYVNATGHSGMATAGSGDVLTGLIAGLLGQKMQAYEAAVLGVYLHGRAGECATSRVGQIPTMATDLVDGIAEAVVAHRRQTTGRTPNGR
ncbi:MAG: NAD(P)H-hydrate dehydratase [Phycisphaerales bacterium]|nr:NAD(P)H-hydrate dehydratase [Phycisphaerales bacterium]